MPGQSEPQTRSCHRSRSKFFMASDTVCVCKCKIPKPNVKHTRKLVLSQCSSFQESKDSNSLAPQATGVEGGLSFLRESYCVYSPDTGRGFKSDAAHETHKQTK